MLQLARPALFSCLLLLLLDVFLLFRTPNGVVAARQTGDKLSNGDDNEIQVVVENAYSFRIEVEVIDELPLQFQIRDQTFRFRLAAGAQKAFSYFLRPVQRGEHHFGALNVYAASPFGLARKRYCFAQDTVVPVYPSFIQMRTYELLAISNHLTELGIKKIRRLGHTLEFEHIRGYVEGDDYRTINWRATARKGDIMVNQYQDEKSQQLYSVIDMGRVMKMPFARMSLLDYAINASLVIANIALRKHDKAGIITFSEKVNAVLPADRKGSQLSKILELLYNQKTGFLESNFEALAAVIGQKIRHRSLLLIFTNFETLSSLKRQLPCLRRLARSHLVVTIFFENTELNALHQKRAKNTEEIYIKTIAEKFAFEKRQIVKELSRYGIHAILTAPQNLTANTINKYLELKARGLI
ncbi:MAG: DUF58 domain-containing protein [bacterium]